MKSTAHSKGGNFGLRSRLPSGLATLLVLTLATCGCRRHDAARSDTLRVAIEASPLRLDPRVGTDQNSWRVHQVLYSSLVKNGAPGEYVPDLAESYTSEDAVTWRFHLRNGVRFHDGRPCTSADVVYTFQSLRAEGFPSQKKKPLEIIESVEAPTPLDVVFRLKSPYASFPLQLLLGIVPKGTTPAEAEAHPIGTGPYRLARFTPEDTVVFARWDGYFGEKARLPNLVYRVVPDATTRALELLNGSLDLAINSLPPDMLPRLAKARNLAVAMGPGTTYFYLAFNFRDLALAKKDVRRALALALDRDALAHGLWRDTVEKTETLLPPGHWARAELPPLTRDLVEARRLLDAAGYPDPGGGRPRLSLTYKTSTDEMTVLMATAIAEEWKEIGVATTIQPKEFNAFYEDVVKGSFRLFSLRWQGIVDPDHYHEVFLSKSVPPSGWNRGFFSDPEMDAWIEDARRLVDRSLRRPLYVKIQERAAEELPYISLFVTKNVVVHARDLTGLSSIPPTADFTFLPRIARSR